MLASSVHLDAEAEWTSANEAGGQRLVSRRRILCCQ